MSHPHPSRRWSSAPRSGAADRFLRAVGIVFAATVVSNGLLFAVSLVAARWLGPEGYGVVAVMLAVMVVLTVPSFSLQVVVAREVARADGDDAAGAILAVRSRQALALGVAITVATVLAAPILRDWLNLTSVWPVVVTAGVSAPLLVMTTLRGVLQGRHRYGALGMSLILEGAARLVAAIVAIAVGAGATGVTAAPTVGALAGAAAAALPLASLGRRRGLARPSVPRGAWATGGFFSGFAILTNTDVLIVKHATAAAAAGQYAAAAFVGKIVLLLPVAVGAVLIPEVTARQARGAPTAPLLFQGLALVGATCGIIVTLSYLSPPAVAAVTFGGGYPEAERLLGAYALAMLVLALASVVALYRLALGESLVAWACLAVSPLQGLVMWLLRDSPRAVIWTMAVTGLVVIAVSALPVGVRWRGWSSKAPPTPLR